MKGTGTIFALLALLLLAGCTKSFDECELVVQPRVMISAGSDPKNSAYMARVYVWYIDEKDELEQNWYPGSYTDAEAGVVRHAVTGEERSWGLTGRQDHGEGAADSYIHILLSRSPVLLVAVDPVNRFYAWRTFRFRFPLEKVLVPVSFKIYDWEKQPYRENEWTIRSERRDNALSEGS